MNIEASLLGLRNTHYADVHGLDMKGLHTTARDLGRLATLAMRNKTFAQIVQTTAYTVPAIATHGAYAWSTTDNLLTTTDPDFYSGAIGIKTGFTGAAGGCLVFAALRPSGELLGVLLGETVENNRFSDAIALLNWGFGIQQQPQSATKVPSATATAAPGA
jgi:D-alanyl-D-alanine carboxypeptidase (penicillin-binding protein 5/6)